MKLRSYQEAIAKKIDALFRGIDREERRFVGVKLPTGGGKSFIFMDQLEKSAKEYNKKFPTPKNCISTIPVKYYSPLKGIAIQTQTNVAKYVILEQYIESFKKEKQISEIKEENLNEAVEVLSERLFTNAGKKRKQKKLAKDEIKKIYLEKAKENELPEEILKNVLESGLRIVVDNIDKLVKNEFPNLECICYQKTEDIELDNIVLEEKEEEQEGLVVVDEAHRAVAKDWKKIIEEMLKRFRKFKFLAITATPERDADGIDAMEYFADLSQYSIQELREKAYLASDMSLVTALEEGLVIKPKVISFDCKLDDTYEYNEIKTILDKSQNAVEKDRKKYNESLAKNHSSRPTLAQIKREKTYNDLLFNFCQMNKLSGKIDFIKEHFLFDNEKDKELKKFLEEPELKKNYKILQNLKQKIDEIDDKDTNVNKMYIQWKEQKVKEIIKSTIKTQGEYLKHGKCICFAPRSTSQSETKGIMEKYKSMMMDYFGLDDEDVMITHSNKSVISKKQDDENLKKFILGKDKNDPMQVMVAMDKFNEGLHVDEVIAEVMARQFIDNSNNDKEDPRITFLQELGRCIFSIDPDKIEEYNIPVVFDLACNFMRFNEKLNDMFKISDNQIKFKELYEKSLACISKDNEKNKNNKLQNLIDILQALSENDIDIANITFETKWSDLEKIIGKEKINNVLDDIYIITQQRIDPNYSIGKELDVARKAFWHEETINKVTNGNKKYYNNATDKFFKTKSFEELYRIGFFKDLENSIDNNKINNLGFITGNCADLDKFYGFNIITGTEYSKQDKENGIEEQNIYGFGKDGINVITKTRYNDKFFRFDSEKGTWINLHTGKDEDLLGYNHDGIRVKNGKLGFDINGLWHKSLENGEFSRIETKYDENGFDVHGFDFNGRDVYGNIEIGGFDYKGTYKRCSLYDNQGYDIDGYDMYGFNKDGVHKNTACYYDKSGRARADINDNDRPTKPFPLRDILEKKYKLNLAAKDRKSVIEKN